MILKKLKISEVGTTWEVNIKLLISEEMSDYWDLESEDEVEDFIQYLLKPN